MAHNCKRCQVSLSYLMDKSGGQIYECPVCGSQELITVRKVTFDRPTQAQVDVDRFNRMLGVT